MRLTWKGIAAINSLSSLAVKLLCCVSAWNASMQNTSMIRASRKA